MLFLAALPPLSLLGCGRRAEDLLPPGVPVPRRVLSLTPPLVNPPEALDWRWHNGTVFTSRVGYQLLPSPCGSCWAFAAAGALSDRVKIATAGRLPDFSIAPQALLDCAKAAGSCNGGNPTLAYEFAMATGLPDETYAAAHPPTPAQRVLLPMWIVLALCLTLRRCSPYQGVDNSNWGESPCASRLCRRCDRFGTCAFVPANATPTIQVAEHGSACERPTRY
jgi:hypothetical protein